jgi:hypothetical protein
MRYQKNWGRLPARASAARGRMSGLASVAIIVGAYLVSGARVAHADSVTMTLQNNVSMLRTGHVTLWSAGSNPATDTPGLSENVYIGQFQWQQTGTPNPLLASHFGSFCIELPQEINCGPTYTYGTGTPLAQAAIAANPADDLGFGPMGSDRAALINELFVQDYAQVTNAACAAQFQIAIWDAIYNYDYAAPHLQFTGISTTTADSWYANAVNALNANGGVGPDAHLVVLTNPCAQDQVTVSAAPLPKPVTIGMALLSTLGIVQLVRRRTAPQG